MKKKLLLLPLLSMLIFVACKKDKGSSIPPIVLINTKWIAEYKDAEGKNYTQMLYFKDDKNVEVGSVGGKMGMETTYKYNHPAILIHMLIGEATYKVTSATTIVGEVANSDNEVTFKKQ